MEIDKRNYVELKIHSVINILFLYFDHAEYMADAIFIKKKLKVKFLKDAVKPGEDYVVCMVKVKKRDRQKFEACMEELRRKMLIMDGRNYDKFCEKMIEMMQ